MNARVGMTIGVLLMLASCSAGRVLGIAYDSAACAGAHPEVDAHPG